MLNESLNQFKFDSTHFQYSFALSTMMNDLSAPDIWLKGAFTFLAEEGWSSNWNGPDIIFKASVNF